MNMLQFKSYLIHYIKTYRNNLILLFLCSFIAITFPSITFYNQSLDMITLLLYTTFAYGFILSISLPIFQFRFLFSKSATDTFFALPIKRNHLFLFQYLTGYIILVVPLIVQFFITYFIFIWTSSYHPILTTIPLIYFILLLIFISVQYAITTLFTVKSNNFFDCFVFNFFELIAPPCFILVLALFLQSQTLLVLGADINLYPAEFINFSCITNLLSFPLMFISFINDIITNINIYINFFTPLNISYNVFFFLYWICIGGVSFIMGYKHFIKRKAEDSHQKSTTLLGYPFLITSTLICSLLCIQLNSLYFLFIILIFCCYVAFLSIAKRKVYITLRHILLFIALTILSLGFQFAFQSTNGFHLIQEYPNVDDIKLVNVDIFTNGYYNELESLELLDDMQSEKHNTYSFSADQPSSFQDIINLQSECSSLNIYQDMQSENFHTNYYSVSFYYETYDNVSFYRQYFISSSNKSQLKQFLETIQTQYTIDIGIQTE